MGGGRGAGGVGGGAGRLADLDADLVRQGFAEGSNMLYAAAALSAVSGFLFGYDTGIISGALRLLKPAFHLSVSGSSIIVSSTVAAAIVGAMSAGKLNSWFGRRPVTLVAAAIFAVGAAVMAIAQDVPTLVVGRAVVGLGVGLASATAPMYISEIAPSSIRGVLTTTFVLSVTGGQFIACLVAGALADVPGGWRYMLGLSGIPAVLQLIGFAFMPESPRYLFANNREAEALDAVRAMRRAGPDAEERVAEEAASIRQAVAEEQAALSAQPTLFEIVSSKASRRALVLGCGMQAIQQLAGINTVMYFGATIIAMGGVSDVSDSIWISAGVAFANFAGTIVGMAFIERAGRRVLALASMAGVVLALALLSAAFVFQDVSSETALPLPPSVPSVVHTAAATPYCAAAAGGDPIDIGGAASGGRCFPCLNAADAVCGFCVVPGGGEGYCVAANLIAKAHSNESCALLLSGNSSGGSGAWKYEAPGGVCPSAITNGSGVLSILGLVFYVLLFSPGMGPLPWAVNSEIYPTSSRSICSSIATMTNWSLNLLVSETFLYLVRGATAGGAFAIYVVVAIFSWFFLYLYLPDTSAFTLEEMKHVFEHDGEGAYAGWGFTGLLDTQEFKAKLVARRSSVVGQQTERLVPSISSAQEDYEKMAATKAEIHHDSI